MTTTAIVAGGSVAGDVAAVCGGAGAVPHTYPSCARSIPSMPKKGKPTVYLLHFERPIHHAQHYLGWTRFLSARLADHRAGRGARLPQVFRERGIPAEVVRTWRGEKSLERQLKRRCNGRRLCPICNPKNERS